MNTITIWECPACDLKFATNHPDPFYAATCMSCFPPRTMIPHWFRLPLKVVMHGE